MRNSSKVSPYANWLLWCKTKSTLPVLPRCHLCPIMGDHTTSQCFRNEPPHNSLIYRASLMFWSILYACICLKAHLYTPWSVIVIYYLIRCFYFEDSPAVYTYTVEQNFVYWVNIYIYYIILYYIYTYRLYTHIYMNEWMNEWCIYIALLLCIAIHPKRFTIMWGGGALSSTTTSVQHPLGWCDGSHRTTAPVRSPHTSYRWRGERDRANQVDGDY